MSINKYSDFWKRTIKEISTKINPAESIEFDMDVSELETSVGKRESTGYKGKLVLWAGTVEHYTDSAVFRDLKEHIESNYAIRNGLPGELKLKIYSNTTLKVTYTPISFELLFEKYQQISEEIKIRETYKWRLIQKFQERWKQYETGVVTFTDFFLGTDFRNLVYPLALGVLKHAVRDGGTQFEKILINLFDESIPLEERVPAYVTNFDELYFSLPGHDKSSFQDERTIATLLTFRYPEKYTFFKDSFYSKLSKGLSVKPKQVGQKLFHYYSIIGDLLSHLKVHPEIIAEKQSRLDDSCYPDNNNLILAQDIPYLTLTFNAEEESGTAVKESAAEYSGKRYWLMAPGERGFLWDEFQEKGIAAVGWDKITDLTKYKSRDDIKADLLEAYPDDGKSQIHTSLCLWEFAKVMNLAISLLPRKDKQNTLVMESLQVNTNTMPAELNINIPEK